VTERHRFEITANRLAALVASSDDAIVGKDLNLIVTSWNSGAERIFGYSAEEMIGTSIMRLIPTDRHEEETEILTRIRRGERVEHFETVRLAKDGPATPTCYDDISDHGCQRPCNRSLQSGSRHH
jgi:PAS domain S-box-containing protein